MDSCVFIDEGDEPPAQALAVKFTLNGGISFIQLKHM